MDVATTAQLLSSLATTRVARRGEADAYTILPLSPFLLLLSYWRRLHSRFVARKEGRICLHGGHEVRLYVGGDIAPGTIDRTIVHLELLEEHLPLEGPRQ